MKDDLARFLREAAEVGLIIHDRQDYHHITPILRDLVEIVRRNPDEQEWFESQFIEMFEKPKIYSGVVIQYCMHVLRYEKVRDYAQKRRDRDIRGTDDLARRVLEAYSPNWRSKIIFNL